MSYFSFSFSSYFFFWKGLKNNANRLTFWLLLIRGSAPSAPTDNIHRTWYLFSRGLLHYALMQTFRQGKGWPQSKEREERGGDSQFTCTLIINEESAKCYELCISNQKLCSLSAKKSKLLSMVGNWAWDDVFITYILVPLQYLPQWHQWPAGWLLVSNSFTKYRQILLPSQTRAVLAKFISKLRSTVIIGDNAHTH